MAATNSTTNLGLPQWVATDKPKMTDFNTAMSDIDTSINLVQLSLMPVEAIVTSAKYNTANFKFIKFGKLVVGSGTLSPTENWIGNTTTVLGTLPVGFKPKRNVAAFSWNVNINNHLRYNISTGGVLSVYVYGTSSMSVNYDGSVVFAYDVD